MAAKTDNAELTPAAQLRSFIDKLDPQVQKLLRSVRAAVRKRLPTANELAYEYANSVVISYSPTDRGIDGIVAISARAAGVALYFNGAPKLPDPSKRLQGKGKQARFIELDAAGRLADPEIKAMIAAAIEQSKVPLPSAGKGQLLIRGAAAKSTPRRNTTPNTTPRSKS